MRLLLRVPKVVLRCAGCGAKVDGTQLYGDRAELEIDCKCAVPELEIAFFYPEFREPITTVALERPDVRRVREGNDAATMAGR